MKAIIYARISPRPTEVNEDGDRVAKCDSIVGQVQLCKDECLARGWTVEEAYSDVMKSGTSLEGRTGLSQAITHATQIKGVLVSYSLSRLARKTQDILAIYERLERCQASVCVVHGTLPVDSTTAHGKLILTLLAAVDEFQAASLREDLRAYRKMHRKEGRYCGGQPPYGQRRSADGKKVERDEHETTIVGIIMGLREQGHYLSDIVKDLNASERLKPRRGEWTKTKVARIIKSQG